MRYFRKCFRHIVDVAVCFLCLGYILVMMSVCVRRMLTSLATPL